MHFKHPEILYFLFLLVIPIIVHLFQFRRFQTEYFTNVRFLREISMQTRKSSTLKKWLLLFTRLLLLTFLILAFAQPYFDAEQKTEANNDLVIVIDNSLSMQAEGEKGELLQRAIQDVIEEVPNDKVISVITNDTQYWKTTLDAIRNDLLQTKVSGTEFSIAHTFDRIHNAGLSAHKDVVVISDLKGVKKEDWLKKPQGIHPYAVVAQSTQSFNASVDSIAVQGETDGFFDLEIYLSRYGTEEKSVTVSIHAGKKPLAKSIVQIEQAHQSVRFKIPNTTTQAQVEISDTGLAWDNTYYFTVVKRPKIRVYAIGLPENNAFLSRIYTQDEFELQQATVANLVYAELEKQDVIVLNELKEIPLALQNTLTGFTEKGGVAVVIPSEMNPIDNLNQLTQTLAQIRVQPFQKQKRLITKINYKTPLYQRVFQKQIENFQYPHTDGSYPYSGVAQQNLIYDSNLPFLISVTKGLGNVYLFTAPINAKQSNFKQSPLVVPTFYKMAQPQDSRVQSYTVGQSQSFFVNTQVSKDEVLTVYDATTSFIPNQEVGNQKVKINVTDYPAHSGHFEIKNKDQNVGWLSANYMRNESDITAPDLSDDSEIEKATSVSAVLTSFANQRTDNEIWRWLLILTLLFLGIEIGIQKFLK